MKLAPARWRPLGRLIVFMMALDGCGLVAGLGEPKKLGAAESDAEAPLDGEAPGPQALAVALGAHHACAIVNPGPGSTDQGTVRCWGSNTGGELGSDPAKVGVTRQPLPVAFPSDFVGASALALAAGYSCAISNDGFLFCWGDVPGEDPSGIHRENPAPAYAPSPVDLLEAKLAQVTGASLGAAGGCLIEAQSLVCWGGVAFLSGRDGGADGGGAAVSEPGFESVAAGGASACAVAVIGSSPDAGSTDVECWGDDTYGQCGGAVGGSVPDPSSVGLSTNVTQIVAGADFACALASDRTVSCWGNNDRGQLGPDAPAGPSATPVPVRFSDGLTASALAAGDAHVCAVMTDPMETVECWGDNSQGQLGVGPGGPSQSAATMKVQRATDGGSNDLPHVEYIAAGGNTTCVVRFTDSHVSCWGANESGQAGQQGTAPVVYATPVEW